MDVAPWLGGAGGEEVRLCDYDCIAEMLRVSCRKKRVPRVRRLPIKNNSYLTPGRAQHLNPLPSHVGHGWPVSRLQASCSSRSMCASFQRRCHLPSRGRRRMLVRTRRSTAPPSSSTQTSSPRRSVSSTPTIGRRGRARSESWSEAGRLPMRAAWAASDAGCVKTLHAARCVSFNLG